MIKNGYYYRPAKTAAWQSDRENILNMDQSLLTHILNGVFGMVQCLDFLAGEKILLLDEKKLRQSIALYTTHDLHKIPDYPGKKSQFDQSLSDYEKEMESLGLPEFADTIPEQHRAAAVSLLSPKVGDLSACPAGTGLLIDLVHLADCIASMNQLENPNVLQNRLVKLLPLSKANTYCFYFHQIDDLRGLITNLLHNCIAKVLTEKAGLYPLLYFTEGILYIGKSGQVPASHNELTGPIIESVYRAIKGRDGELANTVMNSAFNSHYMRFEKFAFLFLDIKGLVGLIEKFAGGKAPKRFIREVLGKHSKDYQYSVEQIYTCFNISAAADEQYNEIIYAAARFMAGARKLLEWGLPNQENVTPFLLDALGIEQAVYEKVQQNIPAKMTKGITYDDCIILAWDYLNGLKIDGRSAWSIPVQMLIEFMGSRLEKYLEPYLTAERCMEIAEQELMLQDTLADYLTEHLILSWDISRAVHDNGRWEEYHKPRSGSQKSFCSICNRTISRKIKNRNIIANIFESDVQTFSNRAKPSAEGAVQALVWCPLCYLEYMMRKFAGVGFADGDRGKSGRLYLFMLPDFSFTRYGLRYFEDFLANFKDHTRIRLRYGSAESPTFPQLWLKSMIDTKEAGFKNRLIEDLQQSLIDEGEQIAAQTREYGRRMAGDQISMAVFKQTNFFVAVYEKSAYQSGKDDQVPTRSELWVKAVYAGLILHQLLGLRIYITDKPYLPTIDPAAYKTALTLDGAHPLLRLLWPQGGHDGRIHLDSKQQTNVQKTMELLSSLWECTSVLDSKDKNIASRLQKQMASGLAGASFYREADREGKFSGATFKKACENLIEISGGELVNLTKDLTDKSLDIFLPKFGKEGKAHRYETVFRTAIEVIKKSAALDPEEIKTQVAGTLYKRLERLKSGDTGYLACWGEDLKGKTYDFAELVVDGLFVNRCGKSLAKLNSLINSIADGIYFETDRQISKRFADRNARYDAARATEENNVTEE